MRMLVVVAVLGAYAAVGFMAGRDVGMAKAQRECFEASRGRP